MRRHESLKLLGRLVFDDLDDWMKMKCEMPCLGWSGLLRRRRRTQEASTRAVGTATGTVPEKNKNSVMMNSRGGVASLRLWTPKRLQ